MAIYDANGEQLYRAYSADGNELGYAYDADGNVIFQKEQPIGTPLRAMTYNVGQWYDGTGSNVPADKDAEYYALQNGMIQSADADLLFLCEYNATFSKAGRTAESMLSQYFKYILSQESSVWGRAICSKYPLSNWTHHSYSNETRRYYDSAEMTVDGKQITVVVTHLATDAKRNAQVLELISYLSTLNTFICAGDFNPITISNGKTTDADDYTNIIVPLLNAGFNLVNGSTKFVYTYNDVDWWGCLDNIVTSPNIQITSSYVDETKLTDSIVDERVDHMPLIAELVIY